MKSMSMNFDFVKSNRLKYLKLNLIYQQNATKLAGVGWVARNFKYCNCWEHADLNRESFSIQNKKYMIFTKYIKLEFHGPKGLEILAVSG